MEQPRYEASPREEVSEDVTVETLKADINQLASTVQKLAAEQIGTTAGMVQERAQERISDLEAAIRRNPAQAAAIAAGAGFVVGLILTR